MKGKNMKYVMIFLLLFAMSCGSAVPSSGTPSPTPGPTPNAHPYAGADIIGSWLVTGNSVVLSAPGATLAFADTGVVTYSTSGKNPSMNSGTYSISGNMVSMTLSSGSYSNEYVLDSGNDTIRLK